MLDSCVSLYNLLLVRLSVSIDIRRAEEISVELLVAIYRAISSDVEPNVNGEEMHSLNYLLNSLKELVGMDLDHIRMVLIWQRQKL